MPSFSVTNLHSPTGEFTTYRYKWSHERTWIIRIEGPSIFGEPGRLEARSESNARGGLQSPPRIGIDAKIISQQCAPATDVNAVFFRGRLLSRWVAPTSVSVRAAG